MDILYNMYAMSIETFNEEHTHSEQNAKQIGNIIHKFSIDLNSIFCLCERE